MQKEDRDVRGAQRSVDPDSHWLRGVSIVAFRHDDHHLSVQPQCWNCGGMNGCRGATVGVSSASEVPERRKFFMLATRPAESDPRVTARGFFSAGGLLTAMQQRQR